MAQTHKRLILKEFGLSENTILTIDDLSSLTAIPSIALLTVYNRGLVSANPKKAMTRVYSFLAGKKTYDAEDADIATTFGILPAVRFSAKKKSPDTE